MSKRTRESDEDVAFVFDPWSHVCTNFSTVFDEIIKHSMLPIERKEPYFESIHDAIDLECLRWKNNMVVVYENVMNKCYEDAQTKGITPEPVELEMVPLGYRHLFRLTPSDRMAAAMYSASFKDFLLAFRPAISDAMIAQMVASVDSKKDARTVIVDPVLAQWKTALGLFPEKLAFAAGISRAEWPHQLIDMEEFKSEKLCYYELGLFKKAKKDDFFMGELVSFVKDNQDDESVILRALVNDNLDFIRLIPVERLKRALVRSAAATKLDTHVSACWNADNVLILREPLGYFAQQHIAELLDQETTATSTNEPFFRAVLRFGVIPSNATVSKWHAAKWNFMDYIPLTGMAPWMAKRWHVLAEELDIPELHERITMASLISCITGTKESHFNPAQVTDSVIQKLVEASESQYVLDFKTYVRHANALAHLKPYVIDFSALKASVELLKEKAPQAIRERDVNMLDVVLNLQSPAMRLRNASNYAEWIEEHIVQSQVDDMKFGYERCIRLLVYHLDSTEKLLQTSILDFAVSLRYLPGQPSDMDAKTCALYMWPVLALHMVQAQEGMERYQVHAGDAWRKFAQFYYDSAHVFSADLTPDDAKSLGFSADDIPSQGQNMMDDFEFGVSRVDALSAAIDAKNTAAYLFVLTQRIREAIKYLNNVSIAAIKNLYLLEREELLESNQRLTNSFPTAIADDLTTFETIMALSDDPDVFSIQTSPLDILAMLEKLRKKTER